MSRSPPSFMDGVPVKISESFKPPPKISLPQSVTNRLAQFENGADSVRYSHTYDFMLEETVLKRITEWRAAKEKERYEREERLRLKEQERIRFIEEEQKRKLNQISYPNTDDLSSASDEEEHSEENDDSNPSGSSEEHVQTVVAGQHRQMTNFDSILIPTVLPDMSVTKTSDKTIDLNSHISYSIPKKTSLINNNNNNSSSGYNKINYSDFENDTSSPFDNMELKTINDLDILAQVLNLNVSDSCPEMKTEEAVKNEIEIMDRKVHVPEPKATIAERPQLNYDQQAHYQHVAYPTPLQQQQTSSSNDYYSALNSYHYTYGQYGQSSIVPSVCYAPTTVNRTLLNQYQTVTNTSYQSGPQSQYQPYTQSSGSPAAYNYYPYTSLSVSSASQPTYAPSFLYNAYAQQVSSGGSYSYAMQPKTDVTVSTASIAYGAGNVSEHPTDASSSAATAMSKSKSKSVPDIVRQLDEEVKDSAQRRTRNNSQSIDVQKQDSGIKSEKSSTVTPMEQDFTVYNQLSLAEQNLVKSIGSMGFPLERVAAVLKRIGSDDKKIVEHLIPLSELLDLGFEEAKISEALLKFENNKHKALDYLIS
ncbi:uncharacterized protein LOC129731722 [Wyeomyia smithii]|uniref:uncharacterized protein LOC129731722 n=1 Tax=Wyeomyia smithii TaxID=174621 RepID=UPI0024681BCC|nr:uncharacterized protein LOC129731722 [Wyeomyia smithii]